MILKHPNNEGRTGKKGNTRTTKINWQENSRKQQAMRKENKFSQYNKKISFSLVRQLL